MTFIAKPVMADSHILNHIARDRLIDADDLTKTKLQRFFKLVTDDGVVHEVTFAQLDGLINILDLSRETPEITPLQYLTQAYDLADLVTMGKDGWAVSQYTIILLANANTVRFEGRLIKHGCADKEFTFALGEFDFIQQFSLGRVIAAQHERLKDVAGSFGVGYEFRFEDDGISFRGLEA